MHSSVYIGYMYWSNPIQDCRADIQTPP